MQNKPKQSSISVFCPLRIGLVRWGGAKFAKNKMMVHPHDDIANWLWDDGSCILWDDNTVIAL